MKREELEVLLHDTVEKVSVGAIGRYYIVNLHRYYPSITTHV